MLSQPSYQVTIIEESCILSRNINSHKFTLMLIYLLNWFFLSLLSFHLYKGYLYSCFSNVLIFLCSVKTMSSRWYYFSLNKFNFLFLENTRKRILPVRKAISLMRKQVPSNRTTTKKIPMRSLQLIRRNTKRKQDCKWDPPIEAKNFKSWNPQRKLGLSKGWVWQAGPTEAPRVGKPEKCRD